MKALLFDEPHMSLARGLLYYLQICGSQYRSTISYTVHDSKLF